MRRDLKVFVKNEDGLVTVEWVALASAVVVGGIALVWIVMANLKPVASSVGTSITSANSAGCQTALGSSCPQ